MQNFIQIRETIKPFKKKINIEGDKSLSIRWALLASQSTGKSTSYNLLRSEDIMSTLSSLKKLGVKVKLLNSRCEIIGVGVNGFKYKNNTTLDCGNSGTFARLILGFLVHSNKQIKLIGDQSLSKRDFKRITEPLGKFGATFKSKSGKLPIYVKGAKNVNPIYYHEKKGSAQCKSSVMLAALNTKGKTIIKAKKSRNHTELLYKYLKLPIKIRKKKNFDLIEVNGVKKIKPLIYKIPSDISSSAFFIVLTLLSNKSELLIKNVNINPSRIGLIKILRLMNVKIKIIKSTKYKGEQIANLFIRSQKNFRPINCPTNLNTSTIDEFLLIFLVAAKANGVSYFKKLSELNKKESPRLKWGAKILNKIGIKTVVTNDSIKIYGNPNIKVSKKIVIKNFLKDHRVFMTSVVAALTFGGHWKINDKKSINSSFPSFLEKLNELRSK